MDESGVVGNEKPLSTMDGYLEKLFRLLPEELQAVASQLRLLREREVFGENLYGEPEKSEQLPRYREQKNRIKRLSGVPFPYWLASPYASNSTYFCLVTGSGSSYINAAGSSYGVCFGFDI